MPRPLLPSMLLALLLQTACTKPEKVQCMPGWRMCGSTCVDLVTDSQNCGECGNACTSIQSCVAGACANDCRKQLNAPVEDPWGLSWDGVERTAAVHSAARSACEAIGGRLPSLSELHRASAPVTGTVGDTYAANVLWALTPSDDLNHMAMQLSTGTSSVRANAIAAAFRCVCAPSAPAAFSGSACQGPAGSECFTFAGDATLAYDSWDRPFATKAAAIWDCAFSGGGLASPERLAAAIQGGLPNGNGWWLHTQDQDGSVNGTVVKWASSTWTASGNVSAAPPTFLYSFRCMGPRNPGTSPASSVAGGVMAPATRVVADGADHNSSELASFTTAVDSCFADGGHLPTTAELAAVAMQGLPRGSTTGSLWSADEVCSASSADYLWTGIAAWPGVSGATVPGLGFISPWLGALAKSQTLGYRCVHYLVDPGYAGPAACNGGCQRFDLTAGRGTGPAAVIWLDGAERDAATYEAAASACAALGGRLASARDLIEGIRHGLPGISSGTAVNVLTSDLCGSSSIYAIPQWSGSSNATYQDSYGVSLAITSAAKYRCMWTNEIR